MYSSSFHHFAGRTIKRNPEDPTLWDLMDQRCGSLTGKVAYTGSIEEIVALLRDAGRKAFLSAFALEGGIERSEAEDQWAGFSRQLSEEQRAELEAGGEQTGEAMGRDFAKLYQSTPSPEPQYVTGCLRHFPMLDRHGKRLKVGDRIRYQYCVGEYGRTARGEAVVNQQHYPYGQIENASFSYDSREQVLRGYHKHDDFEHGHETWVEVIT